MKNCFTKLFPSFLSRKSKFAYLVPLQKIWLIASSKLIFTSSLTPSLFILSDQPHMFSHPFFFTFHQLTRDHYFLFSIEIFPNFFIQKITSQKCSWKTSKPPSWIFRTTRIVFNSLDFSFEYELLRNT